MPADLDFVALAIALVSAAIPVVIWYFVLRQKKHAQVMTRLLVTFLVAGAGATVFWFLEPMALQYLEAKDLLIVFAVFFGFGVVIEYFRNYVVRLTGLGFIKSIDDIIDLSFAAALGFSFFENLFYFYDMFSGTLLAGPDYDTAMIEQPVTAFKYYLVRVFFIPPIHIFCTGLFGYYYGVAIFAGDELRQQLGRTFWHRLFAVFLFFFPHKHRFKAVKIAQGTFVSAIAFGAFFAILQQDPWVSDALNGIGLKALPWGIDEQLVPLVAFFFFQFGTVYFFVMMDKKRRWERLGYFPQQA